MIGDADHVAGERLLGQGAILGEEELRRRERDRLPRAHELRPHAALKLSRADAEECDAVAMIWIHVGLDLEDEAGHLALVRIDDAAGGGLRPRARREFGQRVDELLDAEILERAAPEDRGHVTFEEGFLVERLQALDGEVELVDSVLAFVFGQEFGDARVVGSVHGNRLSVLAERRQPTPSNVVGPGKRSAAADRPGERRGVERERLLDLVDEVKRIASLAVHLVDEGQNGDVAQAADLEQLAGARFDPLCGVDHHDRRIDRGEGPVGVLGEVLVARGVEQVEDTAHGLEGHDGGHDRDAALALDPHPVGARLAAVGLGAHFAGELDRAAEQQHFFSQRRLARVRVRNDRKGAPARDGVRVRHWILACGRRRFHIVRAARFVKGPLQLMP